MIAYPKVLIEALKIKPLSAEWEKRNFIDDASLDNIGKVYKDGLYVPTIFIRIGLFIFTCILATAALGLITLVTLEASNTDTGLGVRLLIYSFITILSLELFIQNKLPYRAGIDDALLYTGIGLYISGVMMLVMSNSSLSEKGEIIVILLLVLPVLAISAIRYIDMLATACTILCLVGILFYTLDILGLQTILPFAGMIAGIGMYFLNKKFQSEKYIVWWDNLLIVEVLSLFLFYLSGNYFVVRELSVSLLGLEIQNGQDIPLAFIFYAFTILAPLYYLYKSIVTKDRVMLRAGLIIVALSVLTFKYYYSLGHHEITLTIAGIAMIAVAWYVGKLLKSPRAGLTSEEDETVLNTNIEAMVITETFSKSSSPSNDAGFEFGGGESGGGGASSKY